MKPNTSRSKKAAFQPAPSRPGPGPTLDDEFGDMPVGLEDEDSGPEPIGVPPGYIARVGGGEARRAPARSLGEFRRGNVTLPRDVPPRYNEGQEWEPGGWPPARIADLQGQMVDAGVLKKASYQRGVWDQASMTAYKKLLAYSNAAGLDYQGTLQRYKEVVSKYGRPEDEDEDGSGREGPVRQPFIGSRIDPARLGQLIDDVSVRAIGRVITPEEKDRFAATFNETYLASQRQEYEASGSGLPGGPGGVITQPDPEAAAQQFIEKSKPDEVREYDALQRFKQFEQLLGRSGA